jgi:DNA (cytosine-5)-methyltransferase 1
MRLTAVDLFAGAGGASQGLRQAGFRVLAAVEFNSEAAESFRHNHPDTLVVEADITDVDVHEVMATLRLKPGQLTVLNACPPCQGFSTLGSGDVDDPRNDLIGSIWPFIRALQPRAIIIENVPGIRDDPRLAQLVRQVRAIGYSARGYTIEAADFGAPQRRRRHVLLGVRYTKHQLPADLIGLAGRYMTAKPTPVRSVFRMSARIKPAVDPHHISRVLQAPTLERIRAIPINGSRFDLPETQQLDCHKRLASRFAGRFATGPYGRMRVDEPSPTLTTRCTTVSCGSFIHPTENRGISLREAALIQTFPKSYRFSGGYDSIERQIGNALPPTVAEVMGLALLAVLPGKTKRRPT